MSCPYCGSPNCKLGMSDFINNKKLKTMERLNHNEDSCEIILTPQDVESAIRQFICDTMPDFKQNWILNPKYNLGAVVFAGTKE